MHKLALPLLALSLAGCGETFKPASYVDKLRLLAIRADVPELSPGPRRLDRTTLTSLVADPAQLEDAERQALVVYLACTPEPGNPEANLCNLVETYADPAQLPALLQQSGGACGGSGGEAPGEFGQGITGGITFAGFEVCDHEEGCGPATVDFAGVPVELPPPTYVLPADYDLSALPAGHSQRTNGVQVLVVAIVVAGTPEELLEGADPADDCAFADKVSENLGRLLEERERLTALKRLQVRGPDVRDETNVNPVIVGIDADGRALPEEPAAFASGQKVKFAPQLPPGQSEQALYQRFTRYDAEGAVFREEEEAWVWSWFATGGEFEKDRTRTAGEAVKWTAPGDDPDLPIPAGGRVFVYGVVRDARGGIAWVRREVRVNEP